MNNILLFSIIFLIHYIQSMLIEPRNAAYCAYLSEKIFCYGGSPHDGHYSTDIRVLDINNQTSIYLNETKHTWTIVEAQTSRLASEFRYDSQFVPMPDGINMFFNGGSNDNREKIEDMTVSYNTRDNIWNALPNFNDAKNGGIRQISKAGTVYIPSLNSIGMFGGHEYRLESRTQYVPDIGEPISDRPFYEYNSSQEPKFLITGSYLGYYYMTLYNLGTKTWSHINTIPPHYNGFPFLISRQTATFHTNTGKIYFIGGLYMDYDVQDISVPLSYSITFDTINNSWNNQSLGGEKPTPRNEHTATMLHTGDDILVYGGTQQSQENKPYPVEDYIYILNLKTHNWTTYSDIVPPDNIRGPRYYHTAVLVKETSLFIMLGISAVDNKATNDILLLDTRDISSIKFSDTYPLPNLDDNATASEKLSGGAIAGIVIGSIAAILFAILGIFFIRKKNKKNNDQIMSQMEVDWDHIDGYYNDNPPMSETNNRFSKTFETITSGSSTQVPFSPTDNSATISFSPNESPAPRYSAYSTIAAPEQGIIKPDCVDDLIKISNSNNSNDVVNKPSL